VAATGYSRKDSWNLSGVGYRFMPPGNSALVDPLPQQNGRSWRETTPTTTATFTVPPGLIDGGLRFQGSTPHIAASSKPLPLTTTWLANRVQTTIARRSSAPRRARDAWSKSQEIHPKTSASGGSGGSSGGTASLRGSSSATLIPVRRRNSLHAVFVDDTRTAVLKDVVSHMPSYYI